MGWVKTLVSQIANDWKSADTAALKEDLEQAGRIGLFVAIQRYNPRLGALTTYAKPWVEKYARDFLKDHGRTIRLPDKVGREVTRRLRNGQASGAPSTLRVDDDLLPEAEQAGPPLSACIPALLEKLPEADRAMAWNHARMSKAEFYRTCKAEGIGEKAAKERVAAIHQRLREMVYGAAAP